LAFFRLERLSEKGEDSAGDEAKNNGMRANLSPERNQKCQTNTSSNRKADAPQALSQRRRAEHRMYQQQLSAKPLSNITISPNQDRPYAIARGVQPVSRDPCRHYFGRVRRLKYPSSAIHDGVAVAERTSSKRIEQCPHQPTTSIQRHAHQLNSSDSFISRKPSPLFPINPLPSLCN
jgi:hypothetical protein